MFPISSESDSSERTSIWKYLLIFLFASVVLLFAAAFSVDDKLHLVFCDVGQGDAVLIYKKSTQILIDGGPDSSVLTCLSNHMPFWDRTIEFVILTHADSDHYVGLIDIVRRYKVETFATSGVGKQSSGFQTLEREVKERAINVVALQEGSRIKAGNMLLSAYWPDKDILPGRASKTADKEHVLGWMTSSSVNEFSVVLGLSYGEFDALLTGDIQPPATDLLPLEDLGRVVWEVLKVPHHGSKNGLTQALLESASPKLAVISVGKNNRYGHPHTEIVRLLDEQGTRILRTDQDREIEIITDGERWWIK